MTNPYWLLDYSKKHFSQLGEDGILEKMLEMLPDRDKWCVEFGAWDGEYLSNTCHFIKNHGFSAVLIEGNAEKAAALAEKFKNNPGIHCKAQYVGWAGGNDLDSILKTTPIPQHFDLLSIDIDGNDYHVWKAVDHYRPKIVIIEYNPTIPNGVNFVQEARADLHHGCSIDALCELGKQKGYELVCANKLNAFFVDKKYFGLFQIERNTPHDLRIDQSNVTWIFCGYDGQLMLRGYQKLPWHNYPIDEKDIQQLPGVIRKYPPTYTKLQKRLLSAYKRILGKMQR